MEGGLVSLKPCPRPRKAAARSTDTTGEVQRQCTDNEWIDKSVSARDSENAPVRSLQAHPLPYSIRRSRLNTRGATQGIENETWNSPATRSSISS